MKEVIIRLEILIRLLEEHNKLLRLSKKFLTLSEVALYMDVSKSHVEKLTQNKKLRITKPGNKNAYVKQEWLEEYLSKNIIKTNGDLEKDAQDFYFND